ncbi:hypothetical protein DSLASN_43950 [Desulfoluna limicola]|uniref:Cytochrome c domain-containing protein n=1 Tax=Desulfoluna limicola TaxID=2810562 RepID=A0ABM7PMZ2_9BACT|nr:hypothetical protein [Desulfoluna limicola]BCS98763.1 hypothetical protein DSLASN_43950 [Desulfoluna limicola]
MDTYRGFGGVLGVVALLVLLAINNANAMPAFARRYQTSCVTCHATFPRLNAVGESFRLRGNRFPDDELYLKRENLELGDDAYKQVWPDAIWPSTIPAYGDYFSATAMWLGEVNIDNDTPSREADVTFVLPHEAEVNWSAPMGEHVAMYGDMIFVNEDNGGLEGENDSWIMGKAWIEFGNLFGPERMFNLRIGTVGIHTIGLFTARDEHSIGLTGYEFNAWMMPWAEWEKDPRLVADDTSFWGNSFMIHPQPGVEVHGFGKRWLYNVGVVNGNMEKPLGGDPELIDYSGFFFVGYGKSTDHKDYYASASYKIGGLGYDGSGGPEGDLLKKNAEYWRDDSLTLSTFGYYGNAKIRAETYDDPANPSTSTSTLYITNDNFWRMGGGALWKYKDLELQAAYQRGHDDQPYGVLSEESVDVDAYFMESAYYFYPWLIPYLRFERIEFAGLPDAGIQQKQDRDILFVGCKAHIYANISVNAEYTKFTDEPEYSCMTDGMLMVMLTTSF